MYKIRTGIAVSSGVLLISALFTGLATAATAPVLGDAASFAVLAGSTVTNTGLSVVSGDLGVSPGTSITGFPPGLLVPSTLSPHAGDQTASDAQSDLVAAYNALDAEPCTQNLTGQDLGGLTLTPGVYCFDSSAFLTGTLTLNAVDGAASVFVFKTGSTLITASGSQVEFIGASCGGVYWKVGSSATLGTYSHMEGSIVALTSITATTGATVDGRLLARNGAVTLDDNEISADTCVDGGDEPDSTPTPDDSDNNTTPDSTTANPPVLPETTLPTGTTLSPNEVVFDNEPNSTPSVTSTPTTSTNPSTGGQSVTLTSTVTAGDGGTPTGLLTFLDGDTVLGTVPLNGGTATLTTSFGSTGSHSITAVFHGGNGLSGSISQRLLQKVIGPAGGPRFVTTASGQLPRTGMDILPLGLSGFTALLIGAGFIFESRRRAKQEPQKITR